MSDKAYVSMHQEIESQLQGLTCEVYADDEVVFQRKNNFAKESRMMVMPLLQIIVEVYDPDLIALFLKDSLEQTESTIEILAVHRATPAPHHYVMKITGPVEVIKALVKYFDLM
jgi:hypothetical protein